MITTMKSPTRGCYRKYVLIIIAFLLALANSFVQAIQKEKSSSSSSTARPAPRRLYGERVRGYDRGGQGGLAAKISKEQMKMREKAITDVGSIEPSEAPTSFFSSDSAVPTQQESIDDNDNGCSAELRSFLIENAVSQASVMALNEEEEDTPQIKACQWLSEIISESEQSRLLQKYALAVFYYSTNGPNTWRYGNPLGVSPSDPYLEPAYETENIGTLDWLSSTTDDECQWNGILCTPEPEQRIRILHPRIFDLQGTIPAELALLSNSLEVLFVPDHFIAPGVFRPWNLPPEFGRLTQLRYLELWGNVNSGSEPLPDDFPFTSIPTTIGLMTNLVYAGLFANDFIGPIPSEIGNLQNLERLILYYNRLNETIPSEMGELTNLETLHLYGNELTGTIPTELLQMTQLREFYLNPGNSLTGSVPIEFCSLGDLTINRFTFPCSLECDCCLYCYNFDNSSAQSQTPTTVLPGTIQPSTPTSVLPGTTQPSTPTSVLPGTVQPTPEMSITPAPTFDFYDCEGSLLKFLQEHLPDLYPNDILTSSKSRNEMLAFEWLEVQLLQPENDGCSLRNDQVLQKFALAVMYFSLSSAESSNENATDPVQHNRWRYGSANSIMDPQSVLAPVWYNTETGRSWWLSNFDECNWNGINCNSQGQVTIIHPDVFNMNGTLPSEVLPFLNHSLEALLLHWMVDGRPWNFPSQIGQLRRLKYFIMSNQLSGVNVPDAPYMDQPSYQPDRHFIPTTVGMLTDLVYFNAAMNLYYGRIPSEVGLMTNLRVLQLYQNQLTGPIPSELQHLSKLEQLWLQENYGITSIPNEVLELPSLTDLRLQ